MSEPSVPGLRPAHRPSRRSDILAAAIEAYGAAQSLEEVTVAQIVARADMGVSAFYYHFDSIDRLWEALVEQLFTGFTDRFGQTEGEQDPADWARGAMRRQVEWIHGHRTEARMLVSFANAAPAGPQVLAAAHEHLTRSVVAIGESLITMAPARPVIEAEVSARALVSLVVEVAALLAEAAPEPSAHRESFTAAAEIIARRVVVARV